MNAWPQGYGRSVLEEVDSTLSEAARIAPDLAGPAWILAHRQTAARGRRGRAWSMPAGNFAATLVLPLAEAPGQAALRSFVVSLALHEAFVAATGRADAFALKWPNDVLLRGGKVAGILLETIAIQARMSHLAIGIGVNLATAPEARAVEEGALRPVALRSELGVSIDPEAFLDLLAVAYARYEEQFTRLGFAPIRTAWLAHAARLGEPITARTTREEFHGTFVDVDAQGQLVLETAQGRVSIPAGDVYF
ncbi:biotin--[acetyl-CoA-carboxylase] ligase [uncultured Tateyamaria sp.]|uniref:biotin--[acetyl-CoA-carboxylase] ligase n=1 Tax=uncultured Tateyamaria sp. TaxID=455651 RepID=UPI0026119711|nr:biotin--[acetyl-CoA-carboxylase] ligase [uncultured Tateyamaria sp.]